MRFPMQKLMNPSSVAVVGASTRPAAVGSAVIGNLLKLGYPGRIYPINPRYSEVTGLRCYPSLRALPETVDAVFIGIPAQGGPDVLEEAAACGVGAARRVGLWRRGCRRPRTATGSLSAVPTTSVSPTYTTGPPCGRSAAQNSARARWRWFHRAVPRP